MLREQNPRAIFVAGIRSAEIRPVIYCALLLVLFIDAELVTIGVGEAWGLSFYCAGLIALLTLSASAGQDQSLKMVFALTLAPLTRIATLALPLPEVSDTYRYLLSSFPIVLAAIGVAVTIGVKPGEIGLARGRISSQLSVAILGLGCGAVGSLILNPEPIVTTLTLREAIFPALILLWLGFVAELTFRGVMQRGVQHWSWGWVYVAALFAMVQMSYGSASFGLFYFVVGLLFGWARKRTGSIAGVAFAHGLMGVGVYLVFPFVF